jgi:hypothetical protein
MHKDKPQIRTIEGRQVVFHPGEGWRCDCNDWKVRRDCAHALKAAALVTLERAMQSREWSIRRH